MKPFYKILLASLFLSNCILFAANAHFQVLIPNTDSITEKTGKKLKLDVLFTHMMEQGPHMNMGEPAEFGVVANGKKISLLDKLAEWKPDGKKAFRLEHEVKEPSNLIFYISPAPYWEPDEGKYIIHYTKVIIDAFGYGEGWNSLVGLPVEIEPLVCPYGLWSGNSFSGIVKKNGSPVPHAEIEVEYWNEGNKVVPASDAHITQVIKADSNGVFHYSIPLSGWWGFAALIEGDKKMKSPDGKDVPVELGALLMIHADEIILKK